MKNTKELLDIALSENPSDGSADEKYLYESAAKTVNAVSSVINFIITDAFNLDPEESLWVSYNLSEILIPLKTIVPTALLAAVQREVNTREYSSRMFERTVRPTYTQTAEFTPGVRYAPLSDWVEGISEIVLGSYPNLRPMIRSSIVGSIHGLFIELGVGDDPRTSRASIYLPNSVRFLLGNNS